jgi:hypothetical protein
MNLEEHTRTHLDHLTADVVGGPDLATAIRNGRRRRRSRVGALAVSALAVAAVGTGVTVHQLQRPTTTVEVMPATQPAYRDFVPGTDVDETVQAAVAAHLTGLPDATTVYPSDWNRNTPLPDSQAQNATDWEGSWTLGDHESLSVSMFKKIPGEPAGTECHASMDNPGLPCTATTRADGSVLLHFGMELETFYRIATVAVAPDGPVVQTFDNVQADSWAQALQRATLPQPGLDALVTDPTMTFPDPVVTPPAPDGR